MSNTESCAPIGSSLSMDVPLGSLCFRGVFYAVPFLSTHEFSQIKCRDQNAFPESGVREPLYCIENSVGYVARRGSCSLGKNRRVVQMRTFKKVVTGAKADDLGSVLEGAIRIVEIHCIFLSDKKGPDDEIVG